MRAAHNSKLKIQNSKLNYDIPPAISYVLSNRTIRIRWRLRHVVAHTEPDGVQPCVAHSTRVHEHRGYQSDDTRSDKYQRSHILRIHRHTQSRHGRMGIHLGQRNSNVRPRAAVVHTDDSHLPCVYEVHEHADGAEHNVGSAPCRGRTHRCSSPSTYDPRELLVASYQPVELLGEHRHLRSNIRRHEVREDKPDEDDKLGCVRRTHAAVLRVES